MANRTRPTLEKRAKERARRKSASRRKSAAPARRQTRTPRRARRAKRIRTSPASPGPAAFALGATKSCSWAASGPFRTPAGLTRVIPSRSRTSTAALERGNVLFLPDLPFDRRRREPRYLFAGDPVVEQEHQLRSGVGPRGRHHARRRTARAPGPADVPVQRPARTPGRQPVSRISARDLSGRARASGRRKSPDGRRRGARTTPGSTWTAFPASPVQGRRILRVFSNVNPTARPVAGASAAISTRVAARFARRCPCRCPGSGALLQLLRVTKTRRTAVRRADAAAARSDEGGRGVPERIAAEPGRFAGRINVDGVHRSGEPRGDERAVSARADVPAAGRRDGEPERSPLRILERLKGRALPDDRRFHFDRHLALADRIGGCATTIDFRLRAPSKCCR